MCACVVCICQTVALRAHTVLLQVTEGQPAHSSSDLICTAQDSPLEQHMCSQWGLGCDWDEQACDSVPLFPDLLCTGWPPRAALVVTLGPRLRFGRAGTPHLLVLQYVGSAPWPVGRGSIIELFNLQRLVPGAASKRAHVPMCECMHQPSLLMQFCALACLKQLWDIHLPITHVCDTVLEVAGNCTVNARKFHYNSPGGTMVRFTSSFETGAGGSNPLQGSRQLPLCHGVKVARQEKVKVTHRLRRLGVAGPEMLGC